MNRVIVVGGSGFFGRETVDMLRRDGQRVLVASRRPGADLRLNPEDGASIRSVLRSGDVVIDAAGPFQRRSTALVETCLSIGCDVIDLADSLDYVSSVHDVVKRSGAAGVRVLTACSSVSAVSAALIHLAGVDVPVRASVFLAPATRSTSTPATTSSFFEAIGRDVRLFRDGALVTRHAFSEVRTLAFPRPVGRVSAGLAESADAITLPRVWPTLRHVDFWVDTRRAIFNRLFRVAARLPPLCSLIRALEPTVRPMAKLVGARAGGFAVDVEDSGGRRVVAGLVHSSRSHLVAVAPAVLAARHLAAGTSTDTGLVAADRLVDPFELREWLQRAGISYFSTAADIGHTCPP